MTWDYPLFCYQPRCCSSSPNYQRASQWLPTPPTVALSTYHGGSLPESARVTIIQTLEQQQIVQDMETRISAIVQVMQVSSSQTGLDLATLMQPIYPEPSRRSSGLHFHPPRSLESHTRTCQQSALPDYSSSHNPHPLPPHQYGPAPRCHSNRPSPSLSEVQDLVRDPSHSWGETIVKQVSKWGSQVSDNGPASGAWPLFQHVIAMNRWSLRGGGVTSGVIQGIERLWDHYSHTMYFYFLATCHLTVSHAFFLAKARFFYCKVAL